MAFRELSAFASPEEYMQSSKLKKRHFALISTLRKVDFGKKVNITFERIWFTCDCACLMGTLCIRCPDTGSLLFRLSRVSKTQFEEFSELYDFSVLGIES